MKRTVFLIVAFLGLWSADAIAQNYPKNVALHPRLGQRIDGEWARRMGLFADIPIDNYHSALVQRTGSDTYSVFFFMPDGTNQTHALTAEQYKQQGQLVRNFASRTEAWPGDIVRVELIDKSVLNGVLLVSEAERIVMRTTGVQATDSLEVPRGSLSKISRMLPWGPAGQRENTEPDDPDYNPNASRYFFAPSAFAMPKGDSYLHSIYILGISYQYAFSDHVSTGIGTVLLPVYEGLPPFTLNLKVGGLRLSENLHAGGGLFLFNIDGETLLLPYALASLGTPTRNVSFGVGHVSLIGATGGSMVINASATIRLGRNVALVSENWFVPNDFDMPGIVSLGVRLYGERFAADLALWQPSSFDEMFFPGIPYFALSYRF